MFPQHLLILSAHPRAGEAFSILYRDATGFADQAPQPITVRRSTDSVAFENVPLVAPRPPDVVPHGPGNG